MTFTDVLTAMPFIKSGKVRALGVTTKARSQALPDVPTVAEQGVPGFGVSVFFGVVAPAGTPPEVIGKLNRAFADALKQPEVRKTLQAQGLEFAPSTTPEQLGGFVKAEVGKWRAVVQKSGAQLD
jgi:tripartite-type tricarboxylate transporter receptor subunit TctC